MGRCICSQWALPTGSTCSIINTRTDTTRTLIPSTTRPTSLRSALQAARTVSPHGNAVVPQMATVSGHGKVRTQSIGRVGMIGLKCSAAMPATTHQNSTGQHPTAVRLLRVLQTTAVPAAARCGTTDSRHHDMATSPPVPHLRIRLRLRFRNVLLILTRLRPR